MQQKDIQVGEEYMVKPDWFGGANWDGKALLGNGRYLGSRVEATVLEKQVTRNNRRDGVRVQISEIDDAKIPNHRHRNPDMGENRIYVIPTRSVVESVAARDQRMDERNLVQAEREMERIEKMAQKVKGLGPHHVGEFIEGLEKEANKELRSTYVYLNRLIEEATRLRTYIEDRTEEDDGAVFNRGRKPIDEYPKFDMERLRGSFTNAVSHHASYEQKSQPYEDLMGRREIEAEEAEEVANAA